MSYRDLEPTVIDLEFGGDPNKFRAYIFLILFIISLLIYSYAF